MPALRVALLYRSSASLLLKAARWLYHQTMENEAAMSWVIRPVLNVSIRVEHVAGRYAERPVVHEFANHQRSATPAPKCGGQLWGSVAHAAHRRRALSRASVRLSRNSLATTAPHRDRLVLAFSPATDRHRQARVAGRHRTLIPAKAMRVRETGGSNSRR